jgi:hypothetical protein
MRENTDTKQAFVIFAVNAPLDKEAEKLYVELQLGVPFKQLVGCYKNEMETCYLVALEKGGPTVENIKLVDKVLKFAEKNHQESVLLVDVARNARLLYLEDKLTKSIGVFQKSFPAAAIASGNWTLDGNQFWVVK